MSLFKNLFGRRRYRRFGRRSNALTPQRGGIALGTILTIIAPFLIRKLQARRAARAY